MRERRNIRKTSGSQKEERRVRIKLKVVKSSFFRLKFSQLVSVPVVQCAV